MKASVWRSMAKTAAATTGYFIVHSLLASQGVKDRVARRFGQRQRNGWYRLFYSTQATVGLGALALYVMRLPDRRLYRVQGPCAGLLHVGQVAGVLWLLASIYPVGLRRLLGIHNAWGWMKGREVTAELEAQGPILDEKGKLCIKGPFRYSRQPLNFGPLLVFWLHPTMTANLATFNLLMTFYMLIGSKLSDERLRDAYGESYADYQNSGVSLLVPWPFAMTGKTNDAEPQHLTGSSAQEAAESAGNSQ